MNGKTTYESGGRFSINQIMALSIGCLLLGLVGYRHYAPLHGTTQLVEDMPLVAVEVSQGKAASEVLFFSASPSIEDIGEAVGIQGLANQSFDGDERTAIPSGTKVSISLEGGRPAIAFTPMAADKRIALGIPVDLNTAAVKDLSLISGIGPGLAQRIVDYRTGVGTFGGIEELKEVSGIGEKRFQSIRKYVFVDRE